MKIIEGGTTMLIGEEKFMLGEAARYTIEGGVMRDEIVEAVCSQDDGSRTDLWAV